MPTKLDTISKTMASMIFDLIALARKIEVLQKQVNKLSMAAGKENIVK